MKFIDDELHLCKGTKERMNEEMAQSLKPVIDKLEDIFDKANTYFYDGKLKKPVITVSPDTANAYGWCTAWKAWADKEELHQC